MISLTTSGCFQPNSTIWHMCAFICKIIPPWRDKGNGICNFDSSGGIRVLCWEQMVEACLVSLERECVCLWPLTQEKKRHFSLLLLCIEAWGLKCLFRKMFYQQGLPSAKSSNIHLFLQMQHSLHPKTFICSSFYFFLCTVHFTPIKNCICMLNILIFFSVLEKLRIVLV